MKENKPVLEKYLNALIDHQSTLFEQGHTFWHCDAHDTNNNNEYIPFRYYQTNRTVGMSTCSTCYKLMELRKEIRGVQKLLGIELTPLYTKIIEEEKVKRMSVNDSRDFNPNYRYI